MLVLTRKKGESIMIGDQIEMVILGTEGDTVKVGIVASKEIEVYRKEVYQAIRQANTEASSNEIDLSELNRMWNERDRK
ncbi:carbon storage regulator CsrA [Paenibacillus sp. J2TS4]|uniref:carbon storage regulator CsrA n=1 Tax=Paenibacillus sp. J2TS4 TaxID=2807194 RepID=UPI001B2A45D8|nr:carbon storage regulator CsrA [Paenibacillus sp. J2TS4]GIP35600.1 carbon storage regulator [Paenibacillus sp. J2TS4]